MARAAAARSAPVPTAARRLAEARRAASGQRVAPAPQRRSGRLRAPAHSHVRAVAGAPLGLLDRLLRGRGWVACVGLLLAGIVYLNVSLLEVNREITDLGARAAELNSDNSVLRERIAKEASPEQIQALAESAGFVLPRPDQVRYIAADAANDARAAAQAIADDPVAPPAEPSPSTAAVDEPPDGAG